MLVVCGFINLLLKFYFLYICTKHVHNTHLNSNNLNTSAHSAKDAKFFCEILENLLIKCVFFGGSGMIDVIVFFHVSSLASVPWEVSHKCQFCWFSVLCVSAVATTIYIVFVGIYSLATRLLSDLDGFWFPFASSKHIFAWAFCQCFIIHLR